MIVAMIGLIGTTFGNYVVLDVPAAMQAPGLDAAIWGVTLFLLVWTAQGTTTAILELPDPE